MRILASRAFFVRFLLFSALAGAALFFTAPRLVEQIQRFSIARALHARFGERFRYKEMAYVEGRWQLSEVEVETGLAHISCSECQLDLHSFPVTLADITAEADVLWLDKTLPPCRISLKTGSGTLIETNSQKTFLTWSPERYQFHDLPCKVALPLLEFLSFHHPLESWIAESGTLTGHLDRIDPFSNPIDFTIKNLALRLEHTPLRLLLDEGHWHATPDSLCTGSGYLRCTLSTSPLRMLEIPKEAWNLSIQKNGAFLTLQSNMQKLNRFFGSTSPYLDNSEPISLEMQLPLSSSHLSGNLYFDQHSIALPFVFDLKKGQPLHATIEGQNLPLSLFASPFIPYLFFTAPVLADMHLSGLMDLQATLNYPHWDAQSTLKEASLEINDYAFSIEACQGPVLLKGTLGNEQYSLDAHFLRVDGMHIPTETLFEAWSGKIHIDQTKYTAYDLDGYLSGIRLTGELHYLPFQTEDALSLHLTGASGKISSFRKLLKDSPPFRFLAKLPCEGDLMLSKEGATLYLSPTLKPHYHLGGSLLDLRFLNTADSITTHDLCCQWRYDSKQGALDLYNLQGTLTVENETEGDENYVLQSDLLCTLNNHSPKMAFDFWIGRDEEEMLRFAGDVSSPLHNAFLVEFCPKRSHFGSAHPKQFNITLKADGTLHSMQLTLPLELAESFSLIQRISRIPYCAIDPLFTQSLNHLKNVQGSCEIACSFHHTRPLSCCRIQSDKITFNGQSIHNFLIEGQFARQQCIFDTLQGNGYRLSTTLNKTSTGWKIPYLALQYEESLLAGFEGQFISSTRTLEGKIPLLTWTLPNSSLYPAKTKWKGSGNLSLGPSSEAEPSIHLSLHGALEESSTTPFLPPVTLALNGTHTLLHGSIQPQGSSLQWPLRPLSFTVKVKPEGYFLQGSLDDPTHPLWLEALLPNKQTLASTWKLYDAPSPQKKPLTIQFPSQDSNPITIKGDLWNHTCEMCYTHRHGLTGTLNWNTFQDSKRPPPLFLTPLHKIPLQADWQLTGTGHVLPSSSFQGMLSVSSGLLHTFSTPPWKATIDWQPPLLTLSHLAVEDPFLSFTLDNLQFTTGTDNSFKLTDLSAQEKPFCAKSKGRLTFPWHPHLTFPSLTIASLEGSLTSPHLCTGEGSIQFHRPSTQKRIAKEDPMHTLIPLPDVLTPMQGTLHWSVHKGSWQIKEINHAYSEGKLVEFLLVPNRPATISETGELDITIQARPAKHKRLGTKRHVFRLRGPIRQPSCVLESKESP